MRFFEGIEARGDQPTHRFLWTPDSGDVVDDEGARKGVGVHVQVDGNSAPGIRGPTAAGLPEPAQEGVEAGRMQSPPGVDEN